MANFFYRCKSANGIEEGYIGAISAADAAQKLSKQGFVVLELKEQVSSRAKAALNYELEVLNIEEKKSFYNSLYEQYKSGITFLEVFNNIITTSPTNNVRTLCFKIVQKLQKGKVFEDVLTYYSKYLGEVEASLIVAGHKTGKLEKILYEIAQDAKERLKIKTDIVAKTAYPKLIFGFLLFSIMIFIYFVFPVFDLMEKDLPVCLLRLFFVALIKILITCAILWFGFKRLAKNKNLKRKLIAHFSNNKYIKEILLNYYFFNFFMTFSLAYEAGLAPREAVLLGAETIKLKEVSEKIDKANKLIEEGCEVTTAFNISEVFSESVISSISTGEKSGHLSEALSDIAQDYKNVYVAKTGALIKSIEPCLLAFAAIFVVIVAANLITKYYGMLYSLL